MIAIVSPIRQRLLALADAARGRWIDVAQEIGVTPEALPREFARRQR